MLTKKSSGMTRSARLSKAISGFTGGAMDRRAFLKRSGLTAGGAAVASTMDFGMVKKANAQSGVDPSANIEIKTIATRYFLVQDQKVIIDCFMLIVAVV